jgi:NADPH:quinone reductase-like Zn-dependent oxidoreductase
VRGLGANEVIDHCATRFEDVVHGVDAVIDLVGGETQARSFAVLRPGGMLISAVSQPDQTRAAEQGVTARFFLVDVKSAILARLADMIVQGVLATSVGAILPLASAREAHEMLEGTQPRPRGRIVLTT